MSNDLPQAPGRRAFFTGRAAPTAPPPGIRPPWTDEAMVLSACTSCNACIEICPEGILTTDAHGRPEVAFNGGECTFCGKCADACETNVFDLDRSPPWALRVEIADNCLLAAGVSCQLCTDICPTSALRLDLSQRPMGAIRIDASLCTGCGACLEPCPVNAVRTVDAIRGVALQ